MKTIQLNNKMNTFIVIGLVILIVITVILISNNNRLNKIEHEIGLTWHGSTNFLRYDDLEWGCAKWKEVETYNIIEEFNDIPIECFDKKCYGDCVTEVKNYSRCDKFRRTDFPYMYKYNETICDMQVIVR